MSEDCVFCSIIEGEIPSHKIYEDENVVAFLDANPVSKGHTLVVPKEHVETIHEAEGMNYVFDSLVNVSNAVEEAFDPEGVNIAQNNGEAAGQEVFHLHFHVTPIYDGNELEVEYNRGELENGEEVAEKLSKQLSRQVSKP
ncbi:MAG: HIT family protein [Candidatus Nanohaloarchaea archaeon]